MSGSYIDKRIPQSLDRGELEAFESQIVALASKIEPIHQKMVPLEKELRTYRNELDTKAAMRNLEDELRECDRSKITGSAREKIIADIQKLKDDSARSVELRKELHKLSEKAKKLVNPKLVVNLKTAKENFELELLLKSGKLKLEALTQMYNSSKQQVCALNALLTWA